MTVVPKDHPNPTNAAISTAPANSLGLVDLLPEYLPHSDDKGNYWLGKGCNGPAILSSHVRPNTWFASLGTLGGVMFKGQCILYFDTPERALCALRAWVTEYANQKEQRSAFGPRGDSGR